MIEGADFLPFIMHEQSSSASEASPSNRSSISTPDSPAPGPILDINYSHLNNEDVSELIEKVRELKPMTRPHPNLPYITFSEHVLS
jgi:hypothetical protein